MGVSLGGGQSKSKSSSAPVTAAGRADQYQGMLGSLAATNPGMFTVTSAMEKPDAQNFLRDDGTLWEKGYDKAVNSYNQGASYTFNAPEYQAPTAQTGINQTAINSLTNAQAPTYQDSGAFTNGAQGSQISAQDAQATLAGVPQGGTAQAGVASADLARLSNGDYNALEQALVNSRNTQLGTAVDLRNSDINQEMADRGLWSSGMPIQQQGKEFQSTFAPLYLQAAADATAQRYGLESSDNQNVNQLNTSMANTNANNQTQASLQNSNNIFSNNWKNADNLNQFAMNNANNQLAASQGNAQLSNAWGINAMNQQNQYNLNRATQANQFNQANAGIDLQRNQLLGNMTSQEAAMQNDLAMKNASANMQSAWTPLDYLANLYGQTGGQTSKNSASAWNAAVSGGEKGAAALLCWVAREIYGTADNRWTIFREWMLNESPKWFKRLYLKHGEAFAAYIADKPLIKGIIKHMMDIIVIPRLSMTGKGELCT